MHRELDKPVYYLRGSLSIAIGLWLMANACTFFASMTRRVGHDFLVGIFLILFGVVYAFAKKNSLKWIFALLGVWIQISALIMQSPDPNVYFSLTVSGILVLCLATVIPDRLHFTQAHATPSGWSYNPSSWMQRIPVIFCAYLSWLLIRYIGAYELGFTTDFYDPFFGKKAAQMAKLGLFFSQELPDASYAAICLSLQLVLACSGGHKRWFEAPWAVLLSGFVTILLFLSSLVLVLLHVGLSTSLNFWWLVILLLQIGSFLFSIDEVVASVQFLRHFRMRKLEFWQNFWEGGIPASMGKQAKLFSGRCKEMVWGVSVPVNLFFCALIGIIVFFDSFWMQTSPDSATLKRIAGLIIFSFSCLAMAEVTRFLRAINFFLSSLLIFLPWFLPSISTAESVRLCIAGIMVGYLVRFKGKIHESYGSWNRYIL